MPRRSPVPPGGDPKKHPALSGGHVVIISGENPIYKQNQTGPQGHAALGQILERRGFEFEPCAGKYNGQKQPSYIVHVRNDGEDEQLRGIAKRMGQEAVVHSQGNQHQYIYTGGDDEGKATPPSAGLQWFGDQEPDDNYTTLYGASGEPIGHFSYILDFGNPLVQHGPNRNFVEPPEAAAAVLKAAVETYHGILLDLRKREEMAKYQVEQKRAITHGPKPVSNDISAQTKSMPSNPHSGNIVAKDEMPTTLRKPPVSEAQRRLVHARAAEGESWAKEWSAEDKGGKLPERKKAKKSEKDDYARIRAVRDEEDRELSSIPLRDPNKYSKPAPSGPVPNVGELTRKTESPMKLHDLLKTAGRPMNPQRVPAREGVRADEQWGTATPSDVVMPKPQVSPYAERPAAPMSVEPEAQVRAQVAAGQHPEVAPLDDIDFPGGSVCDGCGKNIDPEAPAYVEGWNDDPDKVLCQNCAPHRIHRTDQRGAASQGRRVREYEARAAADAQAKRQVEGEVDQALNNATAAGGMLKREPTMKLHDLMKAQAQGASLKKAETPGQGEHGGSPKRPSIPAAPGTPAPVKKFGEFPTTNKFSNKLADIKGQSKPAAPAGAPAAAPKAPVVKNSIFKKMPDMSKAETNASKHARANGGAIKLGKQEFYIDLKNASDPKKRVKDVNPVAESKVPGGKETGWDSSGPKPKVVERSASGGGITKNPPKPGPDQKNTAENSVTEGNPGKKSAPKNDLIEKAAAAWHKRNPNGGLAKAAQSMAAPKAPTAAGHGSPTLSAAAPKTPPATAASPNKPSVAKALMPFSAAQEGARRDIGAQLPPPAAAAPAPKAQPKAPSAYDPSLFTPPAGGVSSGLELAGPPAGMKSRSPAVHKGIRMAPMGKAELCKACGKTHALGKCGA